MIWQARVIFKAIGLISRRFDDEIYQYQVYGRYKIIDLHF
jgi:hypothetical protein